MKNNSRLDFKQDIDSIRSIIASLVGECVYLILDKNIEFVDMQELLLKRLKTINKINNNLVYALEDKK